MNSSASDVLNICSLGRALQKNNGMNQAAVMNSNA